MDDARSQSDAIADRVLARFPALADDDTLRARLRRVAIASDFAIDVLVQQPALLARLADDDGAQPVPPPVLAAGRRDDWPRLLRRSRRAEATRLVWRDVLGLDDGDTTLLGTPRAPGDC